MAKRRRSKKQSFFKRYKELLTTIFIAILLVSTAGLGFFIYTTGYDQGYEEGYKEASSKYRHTPVIQKSKQAKKPKSRPAPKLSEIEDYKQSVKKAKKSIEEHLLPVVKKSPSKRGKLAIVIDDVAYGYQVKALRSIPYPVNLSFFPPSSRHPNTAKYAKNFEHYMIHLPMEALHYAHQEPDTLLVKSSVQTIDKMVSKLRREFPKAKVINNHTGSKFTADYEAMARLIKVLDRYHFAFLDSRTTPKTQVPVVMKQLHRPYLARNVFLDNEQNITYIKKQLRLAVALAKRKGVAVAIGHPHPATIKALKTSQDILKEVKLIYVDDLL